MLVAHASLTRTVESEQHGERGMVAFVLLGGEQKHAELGAVQAAGVGGVPGWAADVLCRARCDPSVDVREPVEAAHSRAAGRSLTRPGRAGPSRTGTARCGDGLLPAPPPRCRRPTGTSHESRGSRPRESGRCSGRGRPRPRAERRRPGAQALGVGS
jgi:hypothetical protein